MRKTFILRFLILSVLLNTIVFTNTTDAAHPVLERLSKRYFKKNKLKKLGKRAQRAAMDIDLEEYTIKLDHDIIGMEPSWMIREGYFNEHYFNLISTLAFGEYDINPMTGLPRNAESFRAHMDVKIRDKAAKKALNIIERATYHNSKLNFLLQVTYSDDFGKNNRRFRNNLLQDNNTFKVLTDSLVSHLEYLKTANNLEEKHMGLFVDFDFSDNRSKEDYFNFLENLSEKIGETYLLYIVVPANIKRGYAYSYEDIDFLLSIADKLVIDATNFDKYAKKQPIPPTNFDGKTDASIQGTLKKYLIPSSLVDKIPNGKELLFINSKDTEIEDRRERLAIMLPYYGVEYLIPENTKSRILPRRTGNITLENFYSQVVGQSGEEKIKYSSNIVGKNDSLLAVLNLPVDGAFGQPKMVKRYYIDDEFTLQNKYFYLKDSLGIDNVALNALSYYKETKEKIKPMWAVLALTYGKEREKLGWIIASYLMGFIPIGFFFSVYRNWEVRNALAKHGNIWTRFNMFFVLFVFLFLTAANIIPRKGVAIIIAIVILGAFFIYIMIKKILMRSKKYVNIVK